MGQWLSPDPAFDGLNLYAYVHNNPVNMVDPTGLSAEVAGEDRYITWSNPTPNEGGGRSYQDGEFHGSNGTRAPGTSYEDARQAQYEAYRAEQHASSYANADKGGMTSLRNEPVPVTDTSGFHTTAFAVTTGIVNVAELGVAAGGILAASRLAAAARGATKGFGHFFQGGRAAKASELSADALRQGFTAQKATAGPLKFVDGNGVVRLTIKQGSSRAPGSNFAHAEFRNAAGQRVDAFGNLVTRTSPGNHSPIDFDLLP